MDGHAPAGRPSGLGGRLRTVLLDPWRLFAAFCVLGGILLIVVPQAWIVATALKRPGGGFTLEVKDGALALVEANLGEFRKSPAGAAAIGLVRPSDGLAVTIAAEDPERLVMTVPMGTAPEVRRLGANRLAVVLPDMDLAIVQKVTVDIFNPTAARPRGLDARVDGGRLVIEHAAQGFLSFADDRMHWTLANFGLFLREAKFREAILNSLLVTVVATLVAGLMAVPLAWLVARYQLGLRTLIISLVTMASVSPPFLGAYAWRMLFGASGLATLWLGGGFTIVGLHGVVWVVIWLVFPVVFLMSLDAFTSLDPTLRESSLSLGASRLRTLLQIEVPLCFPGVLTGLYMAALAAFSDFGTPAIISLDAEFLPKLVYTEFLNEVGGNASMASTGSVLMVMMATGFLALQRIMLSARSFASVTARQAELDEPSPALRALAYGLAAAMLGFAFLPHVTVIVTSFLEWRVGVVTAVPTLQNYVDMVGTQWTTIGVSLSTAAAATALCFVFGVGIAYVVVRRRYRIVGPLLNALVMVPYIIPGTVFAIGFILIFNDGPVVLTGTWSILVLSYFIRLLPVSVKTGEATLYQIHPALEEAGISLGGTPLRVFVGIVVPMMLAGAITGMTLVFLHAVTELSSTILLYRPPWKPIAAVIFENSVNPGSNFGIAAALTVAMMVILYVPLYLITRQRLRHSVFVR